MPFSTVQRESLISPVKLVLMAGLFAVSFIYLKPTYVPGTSQDLEPRLSAATGVGAANRVDELGVAYLKALSHSGSIDPKRVMFFVRSLTREGRYDEAKRLLNNNPDIQASELLGFEIDMELSASESKDSLYSTLDKLSKTPEMHTEIIMHRAVELSQQLKHPLLTYNLYSSWASSVEKTIGTPKDIQISEIFRQCGDYFSGIAERGQAMPCYKNASDSLPDQYSPFDLQIGMLKNTVKGSNEQNDVVYELINGELHDLAKLTELATALLAMERPDLASPLYAEMANKDPDNATRWYSEAARWAEASGKPGDAADYLEKMTAYQPLAERKETQLRIVSLLLGAGKTNAAFVRVAEKINQDRNNSDLLERGVSIALQVGKPQQAFAWNSHLLEIDPENTDAQQRQSELALAVKDFPLALRWYRQSLKKNPTNLATRVRLAEVTEWNGQPQDALKHWQGVVDHSGPDNSSGKINALKNVVRLAEMTIQPREGAKALEQLSILQRPSDADIVKLINFYKLNGESEKVSAALTRIERAHGVNDFLLRTLALHEYEHTEYQESLTTWNRYVKAYGYTTEATLARMELLWRLNQKDEAAQAAQQLKGQTLLSQATDYQLRLMAEISWQYRYDWLAAAVQPRLESIEDNDKRKLYSRRSLKSLQDAGNYGLAINKSMELWSDTGESDFALIAMQLALKTNNKAVLEIFSPSAPGSTDLKKKPEYWAQIAAQRLRAKDSVGAFDAYEKGLAIDDRHVESAAGLLWLAIGEPREAQLQSILNRFESLAIETPELWQPMAVGNLMLGAASTSVVWFDQLIDQIVSDYSMLLTYADALEYAGRVSTARKVRQYTLQKLRPILLKNTSDNHELALRHYSRISTRYESIGNNERLIEYLLNDENQANNTAKGVDSATEDQLWRQDMAISWLVATQQHEHARVVMADLHSRRLEAPAWQTLALAIKKKDNKAIEAVMQAKGALSVGNHILALRQLGNDREAYVLAEKAMTPGARLLGSDASDRRLAQEQYVMLRNTRPSFIGGNVSGRSVSGLDIQDTGVKFRHTFAQSDLGFSFALMNRQLESSRFQLQGNEEIADLSVSMFYDNGRQSVSVTAGAVNTENGDESYATGKLAIRSLDQRRGISAEIAMNESVDLSSELIIAGVQNRATISVDSDIGKHQFMRLSADLTEVNTRFDQEEVATGVQGTAELGVRGSFGSNQWSASVLASNVSRELVEILPEALQLHPDSTIESVIAEEAQTVSLGATLSRGGLGMDYPQVSSPRYYLSTNVGKTWPAGALGLYLDAGAGIRVLGGDELSFSVTHGALQSSGTNDATKLGLNYRFHFQ